MGDNQVSIEVDVEEAQAAVEAWREAIGDGAEGAVRQLAVLSEQHMKEEAPEGVGHPDVNLQNTIASEEVESDPPIMLIKPRKLTDDGWPLHHAIIGEPSVPQYSDTKPPIDPLMAWAAAKLGDPQAAWPIRETIFQDGHKSFPNPFVDRSIESWNDQIQDVADDAVAQAFSGVL